MVVLIAVAALSVGAKIVEKKLPEGQRAAVCLVHLHGDERNALQVAQELQQERCANLVHLDTHKRHVKVEAKGASCGADPNRMFSEKGLAGPALPGGCGKRLEQARAGVRKFAARFLAALDECRGGDRKLPVVALHNNGDLRVTSKELGVPETSDAVLQGAKNPAVNEQEEANFVLVTRAADFHALRAKRNVFLEAARPEDDGSLSVFLSGDRYFNVEARHRTDPQGYEAGKALANDVLDLLGVPKREAGCAGK